ncbi:MAG: 50S ribosomal protein L25 [Desulfotomaculaceae bacterium]
MAEFNLQVNYRAKTGKSYRKELASREMVPGVVYGKSVGSIPVEMQYKPLRNILGQNSVVDLTVLGPGEGETQNLKVLVKDVQVDPIKRVYLNIDFHQISLDYAIQVGVPIELTGQVKSGILQHGLREVQVSCLPGDIPRGVTASLDGMTVGDTITVQDLPMPENITVLDEPGAMVATVVAHRAEAAEPGADEEAGGEGAEAPAGNQAEGEKA